MNMKIWDKNSPPTADTLKEIFSIMTEAFPPCERHDFAGFSAEFRESEFHSLCCAEDKLVGFINYWDFGEFVFLEHFAVASEFRGTGTGTKLLSEFLGIIGGRLLVLEAEPTTAGNTAQRRQAYYKRLGFSANPYPYVQPPMSKDEPPVPLDILSLPTVLSEEQFSFVRDTLYKRVYHV